MQTLVFQAEPVRANPFRVVAIGASNTSGWTVDSEKAYPQVLEQMLRRAGYDVQITNSGRPFDTTAGMLARLHSAVRGGTDLVILQQARTIGVFSCHLNAGPITSPR